VVQRVPEVQTETRVLHSSPSVNSSLRSSAAWAAITWAAITVGQLWDVEREQGDVDSGV